MKQLAVKSNLLNLVKKKLLGSIREAIEKTGLKDGMTIYIHHHFREGDYVINMVMDEIAKWGLKPINRASSIANVHEPLNRTTHQKWCSNKHQYHLVYVINAQANEAAHENVGNTIESGSHGRL